MSVFLSPIGGTGSQFLDNSGNPLAGGKLYTYTAGSTTPRASYTTSAGSTPHTNPIVLDSYGRIPSGGEVWLTEEVSYKFVLYTSLDVLLATWDNIAGMTSTGYIATEIAAGVVTAGAYTDSELVDFVADAHTWALAQTMTGGVTFPSPAADTRTVTGTNLPYYEEGTFTLTISASLTTTPTGTVKYTRVGRVVMLYIPTITGTTTGSVTFLGLSGVPVALRPTTAQVVPAIVYYGTYPKSGFVSMSTDGTAQIALSDNAAMSGGATAGTNVSTITYSLV